MTFSYCCFQANLALFASSFLGFRTLGHLSVTHFQDENLNIAESSRFLPIRHHPYKMVAFCKVYYPCRPTRIFRLVLSLLLDAVGVARCSLLQAFHKPFGKNMPTIAPRDGPENSGRGRSEQANTSLCIFSDLCSRYSDENKKRSWKKIIG